MLEARWYVVQTTSNAEYLAHRNITRSGFRVHLPQFVKPRKLMKNGRPVVKNGKPVMEDSIRPLFPGYLFVQFHMDQPGWGAIQRTEGVTRLFVTAAGPAPMPRGVVEHLMARGRAGDGVIDDRAPAFAPIEPGASARIVDGPFASVSGICQLSNDERVILLVNVLGGQKRVTVAREDVVPA